MAWVYAMLAITIDNSPVLDDGKPKKRADGIDRSLPPWEQARAELMQGNPMPIEELEQRVANAKAIYTAFVNDEPMEDLHARSGFPMASLQAMYSQHEGWITSQKAKLKV